MAETPRNTHWMTRLRKRADRQPTDWGDLGTAIGMEMALVPQSAELEPRGKGAPTAGATARRWWTRRR
jgi:hypothetical protein